MLDFIRHNSRRIIAFACAALVILICCLALFTEGGAGLSDNGDFQRVMDANGLTMADSSHSRYIFKRFYTMAIDDNDVAGSIFRTVEGQYLYKSPHFTFIKISKFINYISNCVTGSSVTRYDIFWLAALYIAVLTAGAYLIIYFFKKPLHQIIAAALFLLMFCDTGHLLYFNSLYGEGLQFVALTLIVGLILTLINGNINIAGIVALFLSIYYFAGSKLANIPLALLTTLSLFIFLPKMQKLHKWIFSAGGLAVAVSLAVMFVSIPSWMNEQTTYQTVFFGILKESPTPEKDLAQLGLTTEYAALANTHAYMSEYPMDITTEEFRENFYNKIGKLDAVLFYAKHPVRFTQKAAMAIRESVSIRPVYLGSSPHERMGQTDRFSLWSNIRGGESILTNPYFVLPLLLIFAFAALAMTVYFIRKKKISRALQISVMLLLLACGIWANILLPVAGNGDADLLKHMYLFIHLTDILLYFVIMAAIKAITDRKCAIVSVATIAIVAVIFIIPKGPDIITFGTYNGKPIQWIVANEVSGTTTLISKDILLTAPFDTKGGYGSNLWEGSQIRAYLNGEFLECFTEEELKLMCDTSHEVTLSQTYADKAVKGWHSPYWRASRAAAADMYDDTYRHTVTDKVYLPSTLEYSKGYFHSSSGEFYLIDPYGSSDNMVRYLDKNGVPVYTDASKPMGIRPVITIERID